ncbi:hypothetical protein H1057_18140 [Clostridium sporogenes]|uniref:hypothetical protein n=1 Tax=Clostridium sporogenes TaxID=1509 RepID=UPI0015EE4AAB|nr:hypothetical protein [Clostridium sporogenes]MBA4509940.1 hypothetical protein [Clostridium sporogenes]
MLDYRIITKEEYKKIRLNSVSASSICEGMIKEIDKNWDRLRKGYDFVIAAGIEGDGMFYSVDCFNEHVLNGKDNSKALTLKLKLDTTEFENKLDRIEKKLETINRLDLNKMKPLHIKDVLEFEKSFNKIKDLVINNHIDMEKDTSK